jgi:hypothetical protein
LLTLTFTEKIAAMSKKRVDNTAREEKLSENSDESSSMEQEMGMAAAVDADHENVCD